MKRAPRFWLAVAVPALLPVLAALLAGAAVWADLANAERTQVAETLSSRLPLVVLFFGFAAGLIAFLAARGLARIEDEVRELGEAVELAARAGADAPALPRAGLLTPLTRPLGKLLEDLKLARAGGEEALAQARAHAEQERNQLVALVAELPQAVIASNRDGRILLYNERARQLFASGSGEASLVGLGRPISAVFDRRLLAHARDRILASLEGGSPRAVVSFITSTVAGRLVRVRVSPVLDPGEGPATERLYAHLLLSEDVTREAEQNQRREQLLERLTDAQSAGLRHLQMAAHTLVETAGAQDAQLLRAILDESARLAERIDHARTEFADVLHSGTALELIPGRDLLLAAQRRIEARTGLLTRIEELDPALWLQVESFALIQVLTTLAQRVLDACEASEVRLSLESDAGRAGLGLSWVGNALSSETAAAWEMEPMSLAGERSQQSIREVLARHDGELRYLRERAAARSRFVLRLPVPPAAPAEVDMSGSGRPVYYGFDLFAWGKRGIAPEALRLAELAYTVFDTETTGLDPSAGDEIIQIGAVRIVNGKLLRGEGFEQLIDPRREIHPESLRVHGIGRERLQGQPVITEVLPAFHAFARDTVLVGHNAAFDMRFLQLKEAATGLQFDQPVLDTLLLSAVLHPDQQDRRLETIAERFGIAVLDRHDAWGDALLTAQIFLRMIPLLAERGIETLAQARAASEKTFYARLRY